MSSETSWPKALIVPHAGYAYSGPVAARAYLTLEPGAGVVRRVVLVGPSHRVAFEGLAVPTCGAFATGLGAVPIDESAREQVLALPFVHSRDDAHRDEHSLEVQLPFLQEVLGGFIALPILVGRATEKQVAEALELPPGTVASRLRRAREDYQRAVSRLRARLSREGGE